MITLPAAPSCGRSAAGAVCVRVDQLCCGDPQRQCAAGGRGGARDWRSTGLAGRFRGHAGAVWVNAAGLINCTAQDMLAAVQAANAAGVPWVLDPVAMGLVSGNMMPLFVI